MTFYKRILRLIPVLAVLVVMPRVADFVGLLGPNTITHNIIRYAFAGLLGLGVVATSYFADMAPAPEYDDEPANNRERRRRERETEFYSALHEAAGPSRKALYMFAAMDGIFNLADALLGAQANGVFDVENAVIGGVLVAGTVLFGLSPTILALAVARVVAKVDRIPGGEKKRRRRPGSEIDWVRTLLGNLGLREYSAGQIAAKQRQIQAPQQQAGPTSGGSTGSGKSQKQRIFDYLNEHARSDFIPGVSDIRDAMEEPVPAKSTISVNRRKWIKNYDPWAKTRQKQ